jgi:hypothetical protein
MAGFLIPYYKLREELPIGARLRVLQSPPQSRLRGPRADIWLTVAAWIWAGYFMAVAAGACWLLLT